MRFKIRMLFQSTHPFSSAMLYPVQPQFSAMNSRGSILGLKLSHAALRPSESYIRMGIYFRYFSRVVKRSSTIVTMLPSTKEVESVYSSSGGILEAVNNLPTSSRTTLLIDSTTLDVDSAKKVSASAHQVGANMVDAPVSGGATHILRRGWSTHTCRGRIGVTGAQAGTLSFLVGGPAETFDVVKPLLALMGQRIIHCGPSGAGLAAKICNNLMLGIEQIAVAEAMFLGQKLGLDPAVLASVVNSSTGGCWASSVNNPVKGALLEKSPPCERDFEGGFATALMHKVCAHTLITQLYQSCKGPWSCNWERGEVQCSFDSRQDRTRDLQRSDADRSEACTKGLFFDI